MLEREPERRVIALGQREVALISETPEDIARARSVLIVDLDDPGLMAHR